MASHHTPTTIADEKFIFTARAKKYVLILLVAGLALFAIGTFIAMNADGHADHSQAQEMRNAVAFVEHGGDVAHADAGEHHHGSPLWLKRIYTSLWQNNVFFTGLAVIGLFFVAIQYAASAGWSAPIKRIPLALAHWLPIAGGLMLIIWFFAKGDIFHWTHADLFDKDRYQYDAAIDGKGGYFYWPMEKGTFPAFFVARLVLFFLLWYLFLLWIKKEMLTEDLDGKTEHWHKARKLSAIFLVIFGYSSSIAAWDWVMSIDTHWFSTMFGWYVFASWWVSGLALITLVITRLKAAGYLSVVTEDHLHNLGIFIFAFSIFWTYIWFSQYLLIYYANIPEETVYFVTRLKNAPYNWIFYLNLIVNFVLPFLLLMSRNSKRTWNYLAIVCVIVIAGHWFDFYNMVTPGVMKGEGTLGLIEFGLFFAFLASFLWVGLSALAKVPLIAKHHPMMEESLHHHI